MTDRAHDYNQLAIVNHMKTVEAVQMLRRRQLNNNIKAFNQALVITINSQCKRNNGIHKHVDRKLVRCELILFAVCFLRFVMYSSIHHRHLVAIFVSYRSRIETINK